MCHGASCRSRPRELPSIVDTMRLLPVVLSCLCVGLGPSACARTEDATASGPGAACVERTKAMTEHLDAIPDGGRALASRWPASALASVDADLDAPRDVDENALVFHVQPEGLVDRVGIVTAAETREAAKAKFQEELDVWARMGHAGPIVLVVRHDTPWRVMVTLSAALAELGHADVDLVFARDRAMPTAPGSGLDADLGRIQTLQIDRRATELAVLAEKAFAPCPPLVDLMESIATREPAEREGVVIDGAPRALLECDCKADVEDVTAVLYALFVPSLVPAVVRVPVMPPSEDAPRLRLPADQTWQDAYAEVLAGRARPTVFEIDDAPTN